MTQYLSKDYLNRMRKKVHNFVEENYWKGDAEKARTDLRDTCRTLFFEMSSEIIPHSDRIILEKHGFIEKIHRVHFDFVEYIEGEKKIRLSPSNTCFFRRVSEIVELSFFPGTALNTYKWDTGSRNCLDKFETRINKRKNDNAVCLFDALKDLHMLETTGKCEIEDLVDAIMAKTASFRTVNRLVKAHSDMEKFLPDPLKKEAPMKVAGADEDSQKRLESFLNDIVEPEFELP